MDDSFKSSRGLKSKFSSSLEQADAAPPMNSLTRPPVGPCDSLPRIWTELSASMRPDVALSAIDFDDPPVLSPRVDSPIH